MRAIRWMFGAAGLVGALLGAIIPGRGEAQHAEHEFSVYMMPSTGPLGSSPLLTSGWHSNNKIALDWDNYTLESGPVAPDVWFHGYFRLSGHTTISFPLTAVPLQQQAGAGRCDIAAVWIVEDDGRLRAIPQYYHTHLIEGVASLDIAVKDTPLPNYRKIAYMVWDDTGCGTIVKGATHSHDTHVPDENWDPTPNVQEAINTDLYPNDSSYSCNFENPVSPPCIYQNNSDMASTTRGFKWDEGA